VRNDLLNNNNERAPQRKSRSSPLDEAKRSHVWQRKSARGRTEGTQKLTGGEGKNVSLSEIKMHNDVPTPETGTVMTR